MSEITKEKAFELWDKRYPGKDEITDCFGTRIRRNDYGIMCKENERINESISIYGWNIDHILPQNHGGIDAEPNYEIMHCNNNSTKNDLLEFNINGKYYKIEYSSDGVGIIVDENDDPISYYINHIYNLF